MGGTRRGGWRRAPTGVGLWARCPDLAPAGDALFTRETIIHPERPFPGVTDLVDNVLAGYAYHLNVMPLDCHMPDPGSLVRAVDIPDPAPVAGPLDVPSPCRRRNRPGNHRSRDPWPHAPRPRLPVRHRDGVVVFSGDTP